MEAREHTTNGVSLAEFLDAMRPRLWAIIGRYRIAHADAEDLLQDAFVAMLSNQDRIDNHEAWLLGTLRLLCCDYWRRRLRERQEPLDPHALDTLPCPDGDGRRRADLLLDLAALIRRLSPRNQRLLHLRYGLGLSTRELAAGFGCTSDNLRKATTRALSRMRRLGRLPAAGWRRRG